MASHYCRPLKLLVKWESLFYDLNVVEMISKMALLHPLLRYLKDKAASALKKLKKKLKSREEIKTNTTSY